MRAPRASPAAAAMATTAAAPPRAGPPAPSAAPASASAPKVATPPARAPSANVAQAARRCAAGRRSPSAPSVSTIERPHGDQAPVTPATAAAASRQAAQHGTVRLVVHDAEHLPVLVAIAAERVVAVDPARVCPQQSISFRTRPSQQRYHAPSIWVQFA